VLKIFNCPFVISVPDSAKPTYGEHITQMCANMLCSLTGH